MWHTLDYEVAQAWFIAIPQRTGDWETVLSASQQSSHSIAFVWSLISLHILWLSLVKHDRFLASFSCIMPCLCPSSLVVANTMLVHLSTISFCHRALRRSRRVKQSKPRDELSGSWEGTIPAFNYHTTISGGSSNKSMSAEERELRA